MIKALMAAVILAGLGCLVEAPVHADPLTPLSPSENAYLEHLHRVMAPSDPAAFHSDGWFLDQGWMTCHDRGVPLIGGEATFIRPVIAKAAFAYLCPN